MYEMALIISDHKKSKSVVDVEVMMTAQVKTVMIGVVGAMLAQVAKMQYNVNMKPLHDPQTWVMKCAKAADKTLLLSQGSLKGNSGMITIQIQRMK